MRARWFGLSTMVTAGAAFLPGCLTVDMEENAISAAPLLTASDTERIPGEYIVVFREVTATASISAAQSRVAQAGGKNRLLHSYSVIPGFAAALDDTLLTELRRRPDVAYVQENGIVRLTTTYPSPADGIDRVDQRLSHNGMYDDHGRTGAGVHLYVIDTGINIQHDDFAGRIGDGATAIDDGRGVNDCNGHGTHVSSTAAGTRYGIAKQAQIHPVRVLDCTGTGTWGGSLVVWTGYTKTAATGRAHAWPT